MSNLLSTFLPKMIHCGKICADPHGKMLWVARGGGKDAGGVQNRCGNAAPHTVRFGRVVTPKPVMLRREQQL